MTSDNAEIAALKNQVFVLLVALIVVSGTLTVYLYRQASVAGKDIVQDQKAEEQMHLNANVIDTLVRRLVAYGEKHPDFVPVLKKNGIILTPGGPQSAPKK